MSKMTGMEPVQEIPPKVLLMYDAVQQLIGEGCSVSQIRVSSITERAGIGKGTAYEYFDSKEEILVGAFIFYIRSIVDEMKRLIMPLGSLREQINYIFDDLDRESRRKYCFVHFVHEVTDNSQFGKMVKERLQENSLTRNFAEYLFGDFIRQGIDRGDINPDIPMDYLVYTVFCKVLTYMMCICTEECFDTDVPALRKLIIEGILRDMKG
ncbi:MAG: TetR/AcrR family transcriptional regulator [Acetatifactor sp.]|nr:TetR/AcrR family transcriptional regulator [Acetatifactor sp.]MDE6699819.1 TetR/AcrR family transcriptional regulator [Acetatifactor sp.]